MSDLYLVLRHRLEDVADRQDWVYLGVETLKDARKRQGLSYETAARKIPTSSKTYERNEKKGRIPRHQLQRYAEVLDLEIDQPARQRVTVDGPDEAAEVALHELGQVQASLDRIEKLLRDQLGAPRDGSAAV